MSVPQLIRQVNELTEQFGLRHVLLLNPITCVTDLNPHDDPLHLLLDTAPIVLAQMICRQCIVRGCRAVQRSTNLLSGDHFLRARLNDR